MADFVRGRVVGGAQQIKAHIDWHSYGELILWPYGYTTANTAAGLTQDDRDAHAVLGQQMAATNSYTPEQASDLYITDGSIDDWMWGRTRSSPTPSRCTRWRPTPASTRRTRRSCRRPPATARRPCCCWRTPTASTRSSASSRSTAAAARPPPPSTATTFETATGWTANPLGTDTATLGQFTRANPDATSSSGAKQLGTTVSGSFDLVTGPLAGSAAARLRPRRRRHLDPLPADHPARHRHPDPVVLLVLSPRQRTPPTPTTSASRSTAPRSSSSSARPPTATAPGPRPR